MLKIIQNNPYRFLGVCSNAPTAEKLANSKKLRAFLKVNKEVAFPLDFTHLMPPLTRTAEGVNIANNSINLSQDQLRYALFWFINASTIDNMALEYLQNGNTSKAVELFAKKETFSSLVNQGVLAFINGNYGQAIHCITKVIHDNVYREAIIESVCGLTFKMTEEDVARLFIEELLNEIKIGELKKLYNEYGVSDDDNAFLREKSIGEPISAINAAIAQAKSVRNDDAQNQYQAGINLMNSTKSDLQEVRSILCANDMQYQMVADNLAKQILQCGINYYNNTNEDDYISIEKAFELQNYALSIAVGKLTKDRCEENVKILKEKKQELPPKQVHYYDKLIKDALTEYLRQPNKISYAINLIKKTTPYLMSIKEELGSLNAYYLRISTLIVNASLHNVIEEFNNIMNERIRIEIMIDREGTLKKIRSVFDQAWKATLYMDKLDMESDFKTGRYAQNRSSLKEQVEKIINISQRVTLDMRGETRMFNDCRTINDYQEFIKIFPAGKFASEVKDRIEKCEYDACKTTTDCEAFRRKYPNTKHPILDKWEECYYKNCNTILLLKKYLKDYPSGKYAALARERIDQMSYNSCKSIPDYTAYIRNFPKGKYVAAATDKIDQLSFNSCSSVSQCKDYLQQFPKGKFRAQAKAFIDDEELWIQCQSANSKDMYKQYLAKFPNGRHKTEAEQKANACYIATMVYGDYNHPQVVALRRFRDNTLQNSSLGRAFIHFYYKNSPVWVEKMQDKKILNTIIKTILNKFIKIIQK